MNGPLYETLKLVNFVRDTGRHPAILLFVGFILLLAGVVGVAISTVYWENKVSTESHGRFGIIFDAGGSGTRMSIYEYKSNKNFIQTAYTKCEKKGLTAYAGHEQDLLAPLKACIDEAERKIPLDVKATTPLFMEATAGMRKLKLQNEVEYNKIWEIVRRILKNGSFPVKLADTMPGRNEAKYSWTAINKLIDHQKSTGLFELGSTSFQVAFEPEDSTTIPPLHAERVLLNGKKYTIYAHSYLCFGKNEFTRRYFAKLTKDSNLTQVIEDPCAYKGYIKNRTSEYLWEAPCVKGQWARDNMGGSLAGNNQTVFTYEGVGNFTKCKKQIESMFNTSCSSKTCGTNNVYQPRAYGEYMAIGGGAYHAAKYLNLQPRFTEQEFEEKTKSLCETNATVIEAGPNSKYALSYCLNNMYTNFLLQEVLKINETLPGIVRFADKINGTKIAWTLGSMINKKDLMSRAKILTTRDISDTLFYALAVISSLLIFLGLVLIFVALYFRCRTKKTAVI